MLKNLDPSEKISYTFFALEPKWRNRQTRAIQNRVPSGVRVRFPPPVFVTESGSLPLSDIDQIFHDVIEFPAPFGGAKGIVKGLVKGVNLAIDFLVFRNRMIFDFSHLAAVALNLSH